MATVPVSTMPASPVYAMDLAVRLDDTTTANVIYVGRAVVGSATDAAVWQIKQIDQSTGLVITWAESSSNYQYVWDDRASYTYG